MEPLVTCQRMMTWFCVYPISENANKLEKYGRIAVTIPVVLSVFGAFVASGVFFVKFVSTDLEQSLQTLLQLAGTAFILYSFVVFFICRNKIGAIVANLSQIFDANKDNPSFRYLAQANNYSELLWRLHFTFLALVFVINIVFVVISLLFCYYINGEFNPDFLYYSYKFSLPWDQKTKMGYFKEICYHIVCSVSYISFNGVVLLLFLSMCLFHQAFYKMLHCTKHNMNSKDVLCNFIRFHISAKDWFIETGQLYSPIIMVQLILNLMMLACAIYRIDLQSKHLDFGIISTVLVAVTGLGSLFFYCYFGKIATDSFEKMADCLYDTDWHELPIELQKYFILMITNTQKSLHYHGFGLAILDLNTFTSFLKAVYTYYMLFKTLTAE